MRRALSVMEHDDPRRTPTLIRLAEAYACDGRSTDAGRTYVLAAERSDAPRTGVLLRKAGDQLMRSGRIDEGLTHLRRALESVGETIPASSLAALADLALQRLWVARRGRAFAPRDEAAVPPLELERIDATWAAATNLSSVSLVVGQDLQARHLRQALDSGEPRRVLRALAVETLYAATSGEPGADATQRLLAELERVRERFDDPYAQAIVALARGMAEVYRGRFVDAIESLAHADAILRSECTAVEWELGTVRTFRLHAAYYLGRFPELDRVSRAGIEDALRRDDLHAEVMLRVAYAAVAALAAGDETRAREEVARARERGRALLSVPTFRYVLMVTEARIERFSARGADAWASFDRHWSAIRRSLMLTKQPIRIYSLLERATSTALWASQSSGLVSRARIGSARFDLLRVERERADWAQGLAALVDGSLAGQEGQGPRAAERLVRAEEILARWDMPAFAAAAALRASQLAPGAGASASRAAAEARLRACGIADPTRMVEVLAPPCVPRR